MTFVRKVVNGKDIAEAIEIPEELKEVQVEVLIFPVIENKEKDKKSKKSLAGSLSKYANKELIEKENVAWMEAAKEWF